MTTCSLLLATACALSLVGVSRSEEPTRPPGRPDARGRFYHSLEPGQQERFLKLLDEWSRLSPAERDEILAKFERYRNLAPEQRDRLREGLDRFQKMPPEQRDRMREHMKESRQKWEKMPPEERDKMRARQEELRQKAEQELTRRLNDLGLHPEPEQLRWIRRFYFEQRREIEQQVQRRQRELKSQLTPEATDEARTKLREQLQAYRKELEENAMPAFNEFARAPHPLSPPKGAGGEARPPRGDRPHDRSGPPPAGSSPSHPGDAL